MQLIEQLKSTFEDVDNPIFITNENHIVLFVNKSFQNSEEDIIGKKINLIKDIDNYAVSNISQNLKGSFYLYIKQVNIQNTNPYKALFYHTPLPYQNLDINGVILKVNKAWTDKFGYEEEEVVGKSIANFLTEKSLKIMPNKFSEFLSQGSVHDAEFDIVCKDKATVPIRVHGNLEYTSLSEPNHTHCILEDITNEQKYKQQFQKSYEETIYSFISITEQKDVYTAGHSQRVAYYASKIAENIGLDLDTINMIYKAGMLHDIGKIVVPEAILLKPGAFTQTEFLLMQEHPKSGYEILKPMSMYEDISNIILHHHERYDGSGYPFGIQGNEIPFASQLLSIADTFDAMTTNRIYKVRKSVGDAIEELKSLSEKWFEAKLLAQAISFFETLPEIKQVNQMPKNELEKQRFSYFFKDRLTNVYNGEYLNISLIENSSTHEYKYLQFIKLHNMGEYNDTHGWDKGDKLLIDFSSKLLRFADSEHIFRVYGDDFIILSKEQINIDTDIIDNWSIIKDTCMSYSLKHYDLKKTNIDSWQKLDTFLE